MVFKGAAKMNLGFYVDKNNLSGKNSKIFEMLNKATVTKKVMDASVFYNDIDHNPMQTNFAMFNATELWAFTGTLISSNIKNTIHAANVVNKFKLFHLFNREDKDLMALIALGGRVDFLVDGEEDQKELYRLTKREGKVIDFNNLDAFLEIIS